MKGSFARTAFWLASARAIQSSFSLVVPIVLVRSFSQAEYGLFKQIDLVSSLLLPLLVVGLDTAITYFVPRRQEKAEREVSTAMTAVLILSSIALSFAWGFPEIFSRIFGSADLRLVVVAIGFAALAGATMQIGTRALLATDRGGIAAVLPLCVGIPRSITIVLLAAYTRSLRLVFVAAIALSAIEIVVILLILSRAALFRLRLSPETLRHQLGYGSPLGAVSLAKTWAGRIDRYLVSSTLGPATFAVYSVGKPQIPFTRIIPMALDVAAAPRYSQLESEGMYGEIAELWRKRSEAILPLNILLTAFLFATAHWFIPLVFTQAYEAAVPVFRVFTASFLIQAVGGVEVILRALAALRFLVVTVVFSLVARIVLCLLVLSVGSLAMLAAVQVLISALVLIARLIYVRKRLDVSWATFLPRRGVPTALALAAGGFAWTALVDRVTGDTPFVALVASGMVWMAMAALMLWIQGAVKKIMPSVRGGSRNSADE